MRLLLDTTSEYGWSHRGHQSWGANWQRRARNEALEQIRTTIAKMVNLKELETFTKRDLKQKLESSGAWSQKGGEAKVAAAHEKSSEDRLRWVNENNFLVDVSDVWIKPGTDWTKTSKNWKGERTWEASATMVYRLRIYGK